MQPRQFRDPAKAPADLFDAADEVAAEDALVVDVEGFEGPLDLLLALARTHKLDLARMSMLALAEQYLAFIDEIGARRLEIAADYLVMAAWLMYLKSRLLLPKDEVAEAEPTGEAMAAMLAFRLRRLDAMRAQVARLFGRKLLGRDVFERGAPEDIRVFSEGIYQATVHDLLKAYADQRRRTTRSHMTIRPRLVWSIKEARERIERLLGAIPDWTPLETYVARFMIGAEMKRTAIASALGASLEMAREGLVELRQSAPFAPIYVRARSSGEDTA